MAGNPESPKSNPETETQGWTDAATPLGALTARLRAFNAARDWAQFHTPKDLALCVSVEAGELLEHFLWTDTTAPIAPEKRDAIGAELADIVASAVNLASALGIDLMASIDVKLVENAAKYPVEKARGRAAKYSDLALED